MILIPYEVGTRSSNFTDEAMGTEVCDLLRLIGLFGEHHERMIQKDSLDDKSHHLHIW